MNIGWEFPLLRGGQGLGLNDSGIETFNGDNKMKSANQEIKQNLIDAHFDKSQPVKSIIKKEIWKKKDIPNFEELRKIFVSCRDSNVRSEKTVKFFNKAIQILDSDAIPVLKVSDYNTTGLTGSQRTDGGRWHNLVRSTGNSEKEAGSGGSFGIGKNAAFAVSNFRTVLYATKDIEGMEAFQGVAKLVTHCTTNPAVFSETDVFSPFHHNTQPVGFFGHKEEMNHLTSLSQISKRFERESAGTDIYILGFDDYEGWEEEMIRNTLNNFFPAILNGSLYSEIEDVVIDKNTIDKLIAKYAKKTKKDDLWNFYKTYITSATTPGKYIIKTDQLGDVKNLGDIELHVLFEEGLSKRIAKFRKTGILVKAEGRNLSQDYNAVLIAKGDKINEILRQMENPQHNKWEAKRYTDDPKFGEYILKHLNNWVIDSIKNKIESNYNEEVDLEELGDLLSGDLFQTENQKYATANEFTMELKPTSVAQKLDDGGKELLYLNTHSSPSPREKFSIEFDEKCVVPSKYDKGEYRISFKPKETKQGYICVYEVGEDVYDHADIEYASSSLRALEISERGKIGPVSFKENELFNLNLLLKNTFRTALEVKLVEH